MKVVILGASGMLGNAVAKEVIAAGYKVALTCRTNSYDLTIAQFPLVPVYLLNVKPGQQPNFRFIHNGDYVINCVGIIKPFVEKVGMAETNFVNAVFPHMLAEYCQNVEAKLIHITTDCVFSGEHGPYDEYDLHDVTDIYGRSKSLGEPVDTAMVIRTSIIGEEIHKDASLVAWVKSQKGKTVNGFSDHVWNGITTNQYGKVCVQIIEKGLWEVGLKHVFSPVSVTKFELLKMLDARYNLGLTINPTCSGTYTNRALKTVQDLNNQLHIPGLEEQIAEM